MAGFKETGGLKEGRSRPMLLDNLFLFLKIVEKDGMAAAGREVGLSAASVTERLAALEEHYGARLLHRTTRVLSLTDEGRLLMQGAHRLLTMAGELETSIKVGTDHIAGDIRISAPVDLGRNKVAPVLDSFIAKHESIRVDLSLNDGYVDLAAEGIDFALRYGNLPDSRMKRKKLRDLHRIICASPLYIDRHGLPQKPADLLEHNCLVMRFGREIDRNWPFHEENGAIHHYPVNGNRIANDGDLVKQWCLNGYGIARKSEWDVAKEIKSGQLVRVLKDYKTPPVALQIVFPEGHALPRRVRTLMDYLAEKFTVKSFLP